MWENLSFYVYIFALDSSQIKKHNISSVPLNLQITLMTSISFKLILQMGKHCSMSFTDSPQLQSY